MFVFLFLALLLILIRLLIRYYRRSWSLNLTVELRFENGTLFEGDEGKLIQTVTNRKLMPFWWGDVRFLLPAFISLKDRTHIGREYYKDTVSVFSYERVRKTVPFTAAARGYAHIRSAELLTQDFFFKYRMIKECDCDAELYCYPDIRRVPALGFDLRRLTGEIVTRRHYIEDPFEFRGIRDYRPTDSLRSINWKATARSGEIKVNEYHCTSSQELLIMLDFDSSRGWDKRVLKEDVIRIAAYLASKLLKAGIAVGLCANAGDVETGEELLMPCRNGANHLTAIYRSLARIDTEKHTRPFPALARERISGAAVRPQYVVISFSHGAELRSLVAEQNRACGLQWILLCEKDDAGSVESCPGLYLCEVSY